MPLIPYNNLPEHLNRTPVDGWPAVTLICGEEMLCQKAFQGVLDHLVPENEQAMSVERFDGGEDVMGQVLASLNTYALLSSFKVVVLQDARLFYSVKAQQGLRDKLAQAAKAGEMKKAARPFLNLLALCGLDFDDLSSATQRKKVIGDAGGDAPAWLDQLIDHCREKGLSVPEKKDDAQSLKTAMDNRFPDGHRLIVTTDFVDRRKALFKAIEENGTIVDCTVPKGESRADRMAQEAVMQAAIDAALAQSGKTMRGDARQRLLTWTGFDLRMLTGNLEKLINFAGKRNAITDADVTSVLQRTRKDPIFEFTNAVAERNLPEALSLMQRLLDGDMHPLQLLAAIANQMRRLLVARDFIDQDKGRAWTSHLSFPQFKSGPFKSVQAADEKTVSLRNEWSSILTPATGKKKIKSSPSSDLIIVKNPRSPFPVYQTLKKADAFSLEELRSAMIDLSDVDLRMKSTGQDPRALLETFLIRLCQSKHRKAERGIQRTAQGRRRAER